ncbi:MAG TPA: hypothetical protein P5081_00855 [Phycisphaerae bacterium]|nr:hypothetical protein [Phycisphaerae bacterium]HRW51401.1 hypothetical protein [Phycisphaerae bacterium]
MKRTRSRAVLSLMVIVAAAGLWGCGTMSIPVPTDNAAALAGETVFADQCARCHSARSVSGFAGQLPNNLGALDSRMNGITLSDEELSNLNAYLATQ